LCCRFDLCLSYPCCKNPQDDTMTMDRDDYYDVEQESIHGAIADLREQIKAKERHWQAYALGVMGGIIGWRIAGTWDVAWGCGLLAAGVAEIATGVERIVLYTRLEGERTRLEILRLRRYR